MKNKLIALIFVILLCSCSKEKTNITRTYDNAAAPQNIYTEMLDMGYVTFDNNQMSVNVTKEDILSLGYSSEAYDDLLYSIDMLNYSIIEDMNDIVDFCTVDDLYEADEIIGQINDMITNNHINIDALGDYTICLTKEDAKELGYSESAYNIAVKRIEDNTISDKRYIVGNETEPYMTKSDLTPLRAGTFNTPSSGVSQGALYALPESLMGYNAFRVQFNNKMYSGTHYVYTETSGGENKLENMSVGSYYIPIVMHGQSVWIRYFSLALDGGVCIYYPTLH